MAIRGIVLGLYEMRVTEDGMQLFAYPVFICLDTNIPGSAQVMNSEVYLNLTDPPSTWTNDIKASVAAVGDEYGFPGMVSGDVKLMSFS